MAATWTVTDIKRVVSLNSKEDVISSLHCTCTDNDGDHAGSAYGSVGLDTSDLSSFIEFADVTADKAVEWLKDALGEEEVKSTEESVASQIEYSKNPKSKTGVPW